MKQLNSTTPLTTGGVSIPPKVDPNDLHDVDGKKLLYRKEELPLVKQHLNNKEYFRKGDNSVREGDFAIFATGTRGFAAMRSNGADYAVYKSKDEKTGPRNRELGHGNFGRVKLAQNLNDGAWKAVKMQIAYGKLLTDLILNECKMNEEVGLGEGHVIRDKKLQGQRLEDFIAHLGANGLHDEADKLRNEEKNFGFAIVQEVVSIMPYIPGNKLTEIIAPRPSGNKNPVNYIKLAFDLMQAYQEQMQGRDAAGKMLPNRTMEIIHRDLKPDNILVDAQGRIKIIDLGFAIKAGEVGIPAGSHGRTAPEVFMCMPGNEKSDVFSLGIVLREILGFITVDDFGKFRNLDQSVAAKRVPDETKRKQLQALTLEMIHTVPNKRPSVRECFASLFKICPEFATQVDISAVSKTNKKGQWQTTRPIVQPETGSIEQRTQTIGQRTRPSGQQASRDPAVNVTPWQRAQPSVKNVAGGAATPNTMSVSERAAKNKEAEERTNKLTSDAANRRGKPPPIHG